jgi:predicted nucleic acid-binding protein
MLDVLPSLEPDFVIPMGVKKEVVDKPLGINEFQFKALRLRNAIEKGTIKVIDDPGVRGYAQEVIKKANSLFKPKMKILHLGEAESLALAQRMGADTLMVDERTTRLLVEDVDLLADFIKQRARRKIQIDERAARELSQSFSGLKVIRSSEVIAVAYKNGFFNELGDGQLLHAALYALKFSGCAISRDEISEYVGMLK